MKKSILYIIFSFILLGICENRALNLPANIRLLGFILYFPGLFAVGRIILKSLFELIYPLIDYVDDYYERKEDEAIKRKYAK